MLKKRKYIRSKKILKAAQGEECLINSPVCNNDKKTVVACHSNQSDDGKGFGVRSEDIYVAFGCFRCHVFVDDNYDEHPAKSEERDWYLDRGIKRTMKRLFELGIYKIT